MNGMRHDTPVIDYEAIVIGASAGAIASLTQRIYQKRSDA